jgi:hypothetical protein
MKRFFLSAIILGMTATSTFAANGDGGYAGAFLRMGFEARSKALGDAFTAMPEGAVSGMYNPALLPHLKTRQVIVSYSFLPLDRNLNYIGIAIPIRPKAKGADGSSPLNAGISMGWVNSGVNNIDGRDGSGNHTGMLSNSENAFYMSFAISPTPILSIGVSGKVLYNRIPDIAEENSALTSNGFGIDVGAYLNPYPGLMLGLAIRDNMSKYSWNTDSVYDRGTSTIYKFPRAVRLGAAYRIPKQWLLFVADYETSDVQNPRFHFGVEMTYQQIGALRLGMDHDKPTFGLGVNIEILGKRTMLNYAIIPGLDTLSPDQMASWSFDF